MISNDRVKLYLDNMLIDNIYKILPLYEEENIGIEKYVSSLLIELYGFEKMFDIEEVGYVSLLANLEGIKIEISKSSNKKVVKREVFRCMDIVKKLSNKLGD